MKKLNSERFYLNRAGKDAPQTVRLALCMKDAVDGLILSEAVADTQKRYPYLCVRLITYKDEHGCEHAAFEDNALPWVLSGGRQPLLLRGSEANRHLLSFAWWDDCIALDFFHGIMDGETAYRVLRTLLYEYCRRRYDSSLSAEGVWTADSPVDEEEWTDPATMPRPESQSQQKATEFPKALNISENAIAPITDRHEVVHIVASEEQMMAKIHARQSAQSSRYTPVTPLVSGRIEPPIHQGGASTRHRWADGRDAPDSTVLSYVGKANRSLPSVGSSV